MRRFFYFILLAIVALVVACRGNSLDSAASMRVDADSTEIVEDGVVYGLACEGCTDSTVWLLPHDASDPIPYDIVNATRLHKIFGRIRTGDGIIVIINTKDSTIADMVVDVRELKGTWCYTEMPTLKRAENMTASEQAEMLEEIPDSIKEMYYHPVEYGFTLKRNNALSSISMRWQTGVNDEDNPFEYKPEDNYTAWHFVREKFVLTREANTRIVIERDSLGEELDNPEKRHVEVTIVQDTTDIVYLSEDSLAIKFKDHTQGYYRKQ